MLCPWVFPSSPPWSQKLLGSPNSPHHTALLCSKGRSPDPSPPKEEEADLGFLQPSSLGGHVGPGEYWLQDSGPLSKWGSGLPVAYFSPLHFCHHSLSRRADTCITEMPRPATSTALSHRQRCSTRVVNSVITSEDPH